MKIKHIQISRKGKRKVSKFLKTLEKNSDVKELEKEIESHNKDDCKSGTESSNKEFDDFLNNLNFHFKKQQNVRREIWNCRFYEQEPESNATEFRNVKTLMSWKETDAEDVELKSSLKQIKFGKVSSTDREKNYLKSLPHTEGPKYLNWVTEGYQTPVTRQGNCNDCYAVATYDMTSSRCWIKDKTQDSLHRLSPQQFLDCAHPTCKPAGDAELLKMFNYIVDNNTDTTTGLPNFEQVPLTASNNIDSQGPLDNPPAYCPLQAPIGPCLTPEGSNIDKDVVMFQDGITNDNLMALVNTGPVVVGVNWPNAIQTTFHKNYQCGLYTEENAPQEERNMNHMVLIVGYNYTGDYNTSAWIVKNSHGVQSGYEGYVAIAMNGYGVDEPGASFPGVMSINTMVIAFKNDFYLNKNENSNASPLPENESENPFEDPSKPNIFTCSS